MAGNLACRSIPARRSIRGTPSSQEQCRHRARRTATLVVRLAQLALVTRLSRDRTDNRVTLSPTATNTRSTVTPACVLTP